MKRYHLIFEVSAQEDLEKSYEWGRQQWGLAQANKWARQMRVACNTLTKMPERFPTAPDTEEFDEHIRQMIIGRYRVLYTIGQKSVHILHVRGAYVGEIQE